MWHTDSHSEDPPLDDHCTAHNWLKPCRECWIAEMEFRAECRKEDEMMRRQP